MSEIEVGWRGWCRRACGALLSHPRAAWVAVALAVVVALPSLWGGLVGDDFHHKLLMKGPLEGPAGVVRLMDRPWDMFRFFSGGTRRVRELIDYGAAPWWTVPDIRGAFWRPIASCTHWLDYVLWPERPALMHGQSVVWYALAVGLVAVLYRRLMGVGLAAGLAAVVYAVDHTHAMPVGFLANRSDLPAVVFGVLCLIVHDRWRRLGWRGGAVVGPVLLALSLLSKEGGLATCAYLAAYEAFLVEDRWRRRLGALSGYALVVIAWRACWTWLGYGVSEIGLYIDPVTQFGRYAAALPERLLVLLGGLWGLPPSEVALFVGRSGRMLLAAWGGVFLTAVAVPLWPVLRRDRVARFWAAGMLLSALPACATFVSGRLLMFAGIGAWGLLAQWLTGANGREKGFRPRLPERPEGCCAQTGSDLFFEPPSSRPWRWYSRGMAVVLVGIHLVLSPLVLMTLVRWPAGSERLQAQLYPPQPFDESIREQDLVVVNPPMAFGLLEGLLVWASEDQPMPRRVRVLVSSNFRPVEVYRSDKWTLVVRPEAGLMSGMLDVLFRGEWRPFRAGEEVAVKGMTVRITEMAPDGKPAEAAFRFDVPLEDATLRWMSWQDGHFEAFTLPPVGERVVLGARISWKERIGV